MLHGRELQVSKGLNAGVKIRTCLIGERVSRLTCTLTNHEVISSAVPVIPQLGFPGKFPCIHDRVPDKGLDDVPCMNVCDDERVDFLAGFPS